MLYKRNDIRRVGVYVLVVMTVLSKVSSFRCYPGCLCRDERMTCSSGRLVRFPSIFPRGLSHVDLSGNEIDSIPEFLPIGFIAVTFMNLSLNRIFEPPSLKGLTTLKELDLSRNSIRDLGGWNSLGHSLLKLDLSLNPLRQLPRGDGMRLKSRSLRSLDLSLCLLERLNGDDSLLDLPVLSVLILSGNPLRDHKTRLQSNSLKKLRLDSTGLRWIRSSFLDGLPSLVSLDVSRNPLMTLESLSSPRLQYLDASSCSLSSIQIINCPNLETLKLAKNKLMEIQPRTFSQLFHLKLIDLSGNFIRFIPGDVFPLKGRFEVNLSGNQIENFEPKAFWGKETISFSTLSIYPYYRPSISFLNLSWNFLKDPNPFTSPTLPLPSSLDLSHNPWHCNCSDPRFLNLRMRTFMLREQYLTKPLPLCSTPESATSLPWHSACSISINTPRLDVRHYNKSSVTWQPLLSLSFAILSFACFIVCFKMKRSPPQRIPQGNRNGEESSDRVNDESEEGIEEEEETPPPSYEEAIRLSRPKADAQTSPGPHRWSTPPHHISQSGIHQGDSLNPLPSPIGLYSSQRPRKPSSASL